MCKRDTENNISVIVFNETIWPTCPDHALASSQPMVRHPSAKQLPEIVVEGTQLGRLVLPS